MARGGKNRETVSKMRVRDLVCYFRQNVRRISGCVKTAMILVRLPAGTHTVRCSSAEVVQDRRRPGIAKSCYMSGAGGRPEAGPYIGALPQDPGKNVDFLIKLYEKRNFRKIDKKRVGLSADFQATSQPQQNGQREKAFSNCRV